MKSETVAAFVDFLNRSPTPNHAVKAGVDMLEALGFQPVDIGDEPEELPVGFRGYVADAGALFAFRIGKAPVVDAGFRLIAAHTDSPNLRIKPQPVMRDHGYVRLGVEVYGGVMIPTWADRDLGMAGIVQVRTNEGVQEHLVDIRRPICRIPTVAIHMNRQVNTEGLKLNAQNHLPALLTLDTDGEDPLRSLLAAEIGCSVGEVLTWELSLYDLQPSTTAGAHDEFVHSGRLDNLGSCFPAVLALSRSLDDEVPEATSLIALFDHEECGSQTARGANSRVLDNVLRRILRDAEPQGLGSFSRALNHSWLISADMAHAVHPAFPEKHDAQHMPRLNQGPVIKQNANKRYATASDTSAAFLLLCEQAGVPVQWYVHRSDLRCGSTVGPMLSARLGVRALDVGNPMLSMHSAREMCGAEDVEHMTAVMRQFLVAPTIA